VIVLAGGFGTRLSGVISDVPKPMAPIGNKPFLDILLSSLSGQGVTKVVLSVGYMADVIQRYFGDQQHGMEILYSVENEPLGTGGAIRAGLELCEGKIAFVLNGDTLVDVNLESLQCLWNREKSPIMVTREVTNAERYGSVTVKDDRIISFAPKGISAERALINAGFYLIPTDLLNYYEIGEVFSFEKDFLPLAIKVKEFLTFRHVGYFIDIGIPEDYEKAQIELGRLDV